MKKILVISASIMLGPVLTGQAAAASACAGVSDDADAQTITSAETEACTVSSVLGIFTVAPGASVDVTRQGTGETAVYIPDNNLDIFQNNGRIAGTYIGVRLASNGSGAANETHVDDFTNDGLITVNGGRGIAAVYNISGFIGSLTNNGMLSNDSVDTSPALNSDLTGRDNYSTALYNLASIDSVENNGTFSAATAITNLTSSGIENRIGTITNTGTLTGTVADGVLNEGTIGLIANNAGGTIQGADTGISNAGSITQITNAGTLQGKTWSLFNTGTIANGVHNSGVLDGPVYLGDAALYLSGSLAVINGPVTGTAGSIFSAGDSSVPAQYTVGAGNDIIVGSAAVTQGSTLMLGKNVRLTATGAGGVTNVGTLVMDESSTVSGNTDNTGTLILADTRMLSASVIGNVSNSGHIVLNPTTVSAGNILTIQGDYTGLPGSSVSLGSVLAGDDSLTDRMAVTGSTSGTSTLYVTNENGAGAATLDGIQLVSVGGNSGATFTLGNRVVAGAYEYSLRKGNITGTDTAGWYLTSLSNIPTPTPEPAPIPEQVRVYRPETGTYAANLQAAASLFRVSLRDHSGESRYTNPVTGELHTTTMWMRHLGGTGRADMNDGQNQTRTNYYVLMLGGDLADGTTDGTDAFHAGLMGGYANAVNTTRNRLTGYGARGKLSGYTAGLYGTWFQNDMEKTGIWADSWMQYSWFNNEVSGDTLSGEHYGSRGLQASLETGYAWEAADWHSNRGMRNRVFIEPHIQALWSGIRADDHTEVNGTRVQGIGSDGVTTRLGLRTYLNGRSHIDRETVREFQPFVDFSWLHNTRRYGVRMNGDADSLRGAHNTAEFRTGVEGRLSEGLTGYVAFTQQSGSAGYRDSQGSLLVSYRF